MTKCIICKVAVILAGIGALNWLLVALFGMNLVAMLLGDMTVPAKIVYTLVGISGILVILMLFKKCPGCK